MRKFFLVLVLFCLLYFTSCSTGSSTPALKFKTITLPTGITTAAYSQTILAKGGRLPYTFSVYLGPLPNGLSLSSSTGVLSGTLTTAGVFNFTIRVTDSSKIPQSVNQQFSVEIFEKLEITTQKLGDGAINVAYSDFINVSGGKAPYIFSIISGTLPGGFNLNQATGEISGTASTTSSNNFEISVVDNSNPKQMTKGSYSIAISPPFGTWNSLASSSNQPSVRYNHHCFYDSKQNRIYVMWGTDGTTYYNDGAYYSYVDNQWHATYLTGAPAGAINGSCVHMGDPPISTGLDHYMFFGGETALNTYTNDGAMYGAENNRWGFLFPPTTTILPSARSEFVSVSLGSYEAFFFGGIMQGGSLTNDGYHYSFRSYGTSYESVWTRTSTPPISARRKAKGVKVGNNVYVWGGLQASSVADTGAYYNSLAKTWSSMNQTNAPSARWNHIMIAVGSKIIVWGGDDNSGNYFNDGAVYDTANNSWTTMNLGGAPTKRSSSSVVYNSSSGEIYIWGGWNGSKYLDTGGAYKIANDGWRAITTSGAPSKRKDHTAVWTGTEMVVFGGMDSNGAVASPKAFTP